MGIQYFCKSILNGKIGGFAAQTVHLNELVGSTKLSSHATCHFVGFFNLVLFFFFYFSLGPQEFAAAPSEPTAEVPGRLS